LDIGSNPDAAARQSPRTILVCLVDLVCLVRPVGQPVEPDKRDEPNKPNNGFLTLEDFFSILLKLPA
jgi:hypothetical protein